MISVRAPLSSHGTTGGLSVVEGRMSVRALLRHLMDNAIIHPDDWDLLPSEARSIMEAAEDRDALVRQLGELNLLNAYQIARLQAGSVRGLVLGHYRVLGSMGVGAAGVVFLAEHVLMRRKVAVKVMTVHPETPMDQVRRFLREVRAVARLDHPNIVTAFDAGVEAARAEGDPDLYYFVMEHLSGCDLEQHVATRVLPIPEACALMHQIAGALHEAHRHQLVHRDIKPSNIFVTVDGTAKLLDFGLVRNTFGEALTQPDAVVGTLEYMAPEQARNAVDADIRSDIFGLGATMFHALVGRSPFPLEGSLTEMATRRQQQLPLSARSLRSDIPEALENVLSRMMALAPGERYPTPEAVMHALTPFLDAQAARHLLDIADTAVLAPTQAGDAPLTSMNAADYLRPTLTSRALIVHPDRTERIALAQALMPVGIACSELAQVEDVIDSLKQHPVDALVLAANLPDDGARMLLARLRAAPPVRNLKIILASRRSSPEEMASYLSAGADDYLALPISQVQLRARVQSAIKHKHAQDQTDRLGRQLLDLNVELERSLSARTNDLVQARNSIVLALARLVEYRSTETVAHLGRIRRFATTIAQEAASLPAFTGQIDAEFIQNLECCAPLHDIGNVGLPDSILLKAGRLDAEERTLMQTHTLIGAETLRRVAERIGAHRARGFLQMAIDIARHHHEHYDGSGYPDGLAGEQIPLAARIVSIADAYDALRSRRSQRPGLTHPVAMQVMRETAIGKYDPHLFPAFEQRAAHFERIYREFTELQSLD